NVDLGRELDAAKAYIAELEAAQPDQGSLFGLDLKNDKPDNIAEAIIGNVDLGRAEKIARAILKAIRAKSQKPAGALACGFDPRSGTPTAGSESGRCGSSETDRT